MDQQQESSPLATPLPPSLNPQVVYRWKAPLRAYKKRSRYVLRFYLALALLLSVIIFFLGDRILIIPIWAILFLFYVLTITPPPEIENSVTKFGLETAGITLRWDVLSHFYFTKRFGFTVLTVVSKAPYNMHTYLIVPTDSIKKQAMDILAEHIIYKEKPELTYVDRIIHLLTYLIPEDDEEEVPAKLIMHPEHESKLSEVKDTLEALFQKKQDPSHLPPSFDPMSKPLHQ
ncbi:MAG: hypothetical protein O3B87_04115 [bacterium]|nr:hypothetical protein [bacterium]